MSLLTQAESAAVDMAQTWAGLPVAVVIVLLAAAAWRIHSTGKVITDREHDAVIAELRASHDAVVAELRQQIETAQRHRTEALGEVARWQAVALRLLNVSEAAVARREET